MFDAHGWSGDNRAVARDVAGQYLANRLCGAQGEKAYYARWQNKRIHLHFIGHSHGGNVINAATEHMVTLGHQWPKAWQVKSITYLSTPFFNQLHQVNEGCFHPRARVLNVTNDYDLTQHMLADFSLKPLPDMTQMAELHAFTRTLDTLLGFDFAPITEAVQAIRPAPAGIDLIPPGIDWELVIDYKQGSILILHIALLFAHIYRVLDDALKLIERLSDDITHSPPEHYSQRFKEMLHYTGAVIPEEQKEKLAEIISRLQEPLAGNPKKEQAGIIQRLRGLKKRPSQWRALSDQGYFGSVGYK